MNIITYIEPILNAEQLITLLLKQEFGADEPTASVIYQFGVRQHVEKLKDSLYIVAETNYIDKVYRDSYYHYYSSKLTDHKRNCLRLSLFDGKVEPGDFRDKQKLAKLEDSYRGFIILRPNGYKIIGRSVISPDALRERNFTCCTAPYDTTVNSVKLSVEGFPHASQDSETTTCAETTLWAIMEYFSHRYPEYKPTLPSKIIEILNKVSSERLIPAKGLNIQQMSYALKEFGFGARIYSRTEYAEFDALLSCYVESGLPLIIAMDNLEEGGAIAHAKLCVGHEQVTAEMLDHLSPYPISNTELLNTANDNRITIYDYDYIDKQFLFIDDNLPVYQKASLAAPAAHYNKTSWDDCSLTYFIVPLYPKIYLEAFEAKNYILQFLLAGPVPINPDSELLMRAFLTSTRSYKDKLAYNPSFSADVKDLILETVMPKFIWVCELSSKALMRENEAYGLVILDATEANTFFNKALIIAAYQDKVINIKADTGELQQKDLHLDSFDIFENNLKQFFV